MDIGGIDLTLLGVPTREDRDVIGRYFKHLWPEHVVDESEAPEILYIYEDQASSDSWDEHGRTDDNDESMVIVWFEDDAMAFTCGEKSETIILELIQNIVQNRTAFGRC